jgi:hypothetical protein
MNAGKCRLSVHWVGFVVLVLHLYGNLNRPVQRQMLLITTGTTFSLPWKRTPDCKQAFYIQRPAPCHAMSNFRRTFQTSPSGLAVYRKALFVTNGLFTICWTCNPDGSHVFGSRSDTFRSVIPVRRYFSIGYSRHIVWRAIPNYTTQDCGQYSYTCEHVRAVIDTTCFGLK